MVPALVGLKGNLEMTLASRLSTAVSASTQTYNNKIRKTFRGTPVKTNYLKKKKEKLFLSFCKRILSSQSEQNRGLLKLLFG